MGETHKKIHYVNLQRIKENYCFVTGNLCECLQARARDIFKWIVLLRSNKWHRFFFWYIRDNFLHVLWRTFCKNGCMWNVVKCDMKDIYVVFLFLAWAQASNIIWVTCKKWKVICSTNHIFQCSSIDHSHYLSFTVFHNIDGDERQF